MVEDSLRPNGLSEVSQLAILLADHILAENREGRPAQQKIAALRKAAALLEDLREPIPERVVDALIQPREQGSVPGARDRGGRARDTGRVGWVPRLLSSMRRSRA